MYFKFRVFGIKTTFNFAAGLVTILEILVVFFPSFVLFSFFPPIDAFDAHVIELFCSIVISKKWQLIVLTKCNSPLTHKYEQLKYSNY